MLVVVVSFIGFSQSPTVTRATDDDVINRVAPDLIFHIRPGPDLGLQIRPGPGLEPNVLELEA